MPEPEIRKLGNREPEIRQQAIENSAIGNREPVIGNPQLETGLPGSRQDSRAVECPEGQRVRFTRERAHSLSGADTLYDSHIFRTVRFNTVSLKLLFIR